MLKKENFQIDGITCKSCKTLIETEVDVLPGVNKVEVNHVTGKTEIEFDDKKISRKKILKKIEKLGYEITKKGEDGNEKKSFDPSSILFLAIVIAVIFLGYSLINRSGGFELLSKLNEENVSLGIIFIIGVLSSFHCVGMCGGLVVAYSVGDGKKKSEKPHLAHWQYNLGRLISYSAVGAILGGIGSFFGINPTFTGTVTLLAGIFMILMGISFLGNFKILEKIKLRTPAWIARFLYNQKHNEKNQKRKGPFVIGISTGFMPCGPLQAIQLFALTTGKIWMGALVMALYALGTAPLMFGFGMAISKVSKENIKSLIKFSGIFVIILGIFMINRGLVNFGYNTGSIFGDNPQSGVVESVSNNGDVQVVEMELNKFGYEPNVLYIKSGVPVRWEINVKEMTGCTNAIEIESLGVEQDLKVGKNVIEFTPPKNVSEIKFSCWMKMVWGKFVVKDGNVKGAIDAPSKEEIEKEKDSLPSGGGCGGGGGCGCGG